MFEEQVKKTPKTNEIEGKAETVLPAFNSRRKYVYGARKYTFLKAGEKAPRELQDVQIIIFDDAHNLDIACDKSKFSDQDTISVDEYIINIIKYWEKNFVIDLFVETEKKEEIDSETSYLGPLVKKLSSCLYSDKSECPYNNLRAHWTDNRLEIFAFEKFKTFWNAFLSIYWLGFIVTLSKPIEGSHYDFFYENVQIYLQGNEDKLVTHPDWIKKMDNSLEGLYLLDAFKIKKQINNIEIKTVREELLRMVEMKELELNSEIKKKERENLFLTIHECLVEFVDDYQKDLSANRMIGRHRFIDGSIKIYLSPTFIRKFEQYFNLFKSTMDFISPFMDLYLLARLFRTYKNPGRGRSAGEMAQRIIIIAGWHHTKMYWNFFNKMGITEIMDTQETRLDLHAECLDLKREDLIPFTPIKKDLNPYSQVNELIFSKMLNFFV